MDTLAELRHPAARGALCIVRQAAAVSPCDEVLTGYTVVCVRGAHVIHIFLPGRLMQVLREQLARRAGPGGEALVPTLSRALADLQERLIYRCVCVCAAVQCVL